ncbi:MAG: hypothetical protein D8M59_10945 [Planctomycetes bacterium]|nr:hypothetical protein [Planctomycetota bacterium]
MVLVMLTAWTAAVVEVAVVVGAETSSGGLESAACGVSGVVLVPVEAACTNQPPCGRDLTAMSQTAAGIRPIV